VEVKRTSNYRTVIETTVDEKKTLDLAQRMLRAHVPVADVRKLLNKFHLDHVLINDKNQLVMTVILRDSILK
jgi:DUF971 family protein